MSKLFYASSNSYSEAYLQIVQQVIEDVVIIHIHTLPGGKNNPITIWLVAIASGTHHIGDRGS